MAADQFPGVESQRFCEKVVGLACGNRLHCGFAAGAECGSRLEQKLLGEQYLCAFRQNLFSPLLLPQVEGDPEPLGQSCGPTFEWRGARHLLTAIIIRPCED
jgi:hypothetical protein